MDEFFVQLSELARAGWTFQIASEPRQATMLATCGVILWKYTRAAEEEVTGETPAYSLIDWINLFAPEIELRKAVARMHARIFSKFAVWESCGVRNLFVSGLTPFTISVGQRTRKFFGNCTV